MHQGKLHIDVLVLEGLSMVSNNWLGVNITIPDLPIVNITTLIRELNDNWLRSVVWIRPEHFFFLPCLGWLLLMLFTNYSTWSGIVI
jgi:hypothetical protein